MSPGTSHLARSPPCAIWARVSKDEQGSGNHLVALRAEATAEAVLTASLLMRILDRVEASLSP